MEDGTMRKLMVVWVVAVAVGVMVALGGGCGGGCSSPGAGTGEAVVVTAEVLDIVIPLMVAGPMYL